MSKKYSKVLKRINGYKDAKEDSEELKGFGDIEDGRYQAQIESAELAISQKDRAQINIFGKITEGEYEGEQFAAFPGLEGKSLKFTLAMLGRLDYELPDAADGIEDIVEDLDSNGASVIIVIKNGFCNIEKLNDDAEEVEEGEEEPEDPEVEEEEPEEEEPEEEDPEEEEGIDLEELSRKELKTLIKDQELDVKVTKNMTDDDIRKAIEDANEEPEEEEEEEEEEVPETPKKKPKGKAAKKKVAKKKGKK